MPLGGLDRKRFRRQDETKGTAAQEVEDARNARCGSDGGTMATQDKRPTPSGKGSGLIGMLQGGQKGLGPELRMLVAGRQKNGCFAVHESIGHRVDRSNHRDPSSQGDQRFGPWSAARFGQEEDITGLHRRHRQARIRRAGDGCDATQEAQSPGESPYGRRVVGGKLDDAHEVGMPLEGGAGGPQRGGERPIIAPLTKDRDHPRRTDARLKGVLDTYA